MQCNVIPAFYGRTDGRTDGQTEMAKQYRVLHAMPLYARDNKLERTDIVVVFQQCDYDGREEAPVS